MKKKKKEEFVQICPVCGSVDIGINFDNSAAWAYGAPPNYECHSCGNIGTVFPEVLKEDVPKQIKKAKKKGKNVKPNIDNTIKFDLKQDKSNDDTADHLIFASIFVMVSFFAGLYAGFILLAIMYLIRYVWDKYLKGEKEPDNIQFCPKCGSQNIQLSNLTNLGDPLKIQGMVGWDCLDCKYTGKDFFITSEEEYEHLVKTKFKKKKK